MVLLLIPATPGIRTGIDLEKKNRVERFLLQQQPEILGCRPTRLQQIYRYKRSHFLKLAHPIRPS